MAKNHDSRQCPYRERTHIRNGPQGPAAVVPAAELRPKPRHQTERLKESRQQERIPRPSPGHPRKDKTYAAGQKRGSGPAQDQAQKGKTPRGCPTGIDDSLCHRLGVHCAFCRSWFEELQTVRRICELCRSKRLGNRIGAFAVVIAWIVAVEIDGNHIWQFPIGIKAQFQCGDWILFLKGGIQLIDNWSTHNRIIATIALPEAGKPTGGR